MVAPPIPPPNNPFRSVRLPEPPTSYRRLPSRHFCQTGELEPGEIYNQDLHNVGTTPRERCARFYPEYRGGKKKRKGRTRKNKKSRKNRKRSYRNRY